MLSAGWRTKAANLAAIPLLLFFAWLWASRMPAVVAAFKPPHYPARPTAAFDGPSTPAPVMGPAPLTVPTRDPFAPPPAMQAASITPAAMIGRGSSAGAAPLLLQGIIWGVQPPKAILNDRVLTIGESINGAQIVSIDPSGVTVEYQGQRAVLRLPPLPPAGRD